MMMADDEIKKLQDWWLDNKCSHISCGGDFNWCDMEEISEYFYKESASAERERLISLLKKKSVFVVFPKLRAEIEKGK